MAYKGIKIKTGEYEVCASGQVMVLSDKETSIQIEGDTEAMIFRFYFIDEKLGEKPSYEVLTESTSSLKINFKNFTNVPGGLANINPIEVGTLDTRKLFLNFRVISFDAKTQRVLEYTLLLL